MVQLGDWLPPADMFSFRYIKLGNTTDLVRGDDGLPQRRNKANCFYEGDVCRRGRRSQGNGRGRSASTDDRAEQFARQRTGKSRHGLQSPSAPTDRMRPCHQRRKSLFVCNRDYVFKTYATQQRHTIRVAAHATDRQGITARKSREALPATRATATCLPSVTTRPAYGSAAPCRHPCRTSEENWPHG